jgi:hypothetical protein
VIPSGAESTLCLNIGQNVEQDNLDLETALYAVMDPRSNISDVTSGVLYATGHQY